MDHETQLGFREFSLLEQPGFIVGGAVASLSFSSPKSIVIFSKLLWLPRHRSGGLSTLRCSSEMKSRHLVSINTCRKNSRTMSLPSSRSRWMQNTIWSQLGLLISSDQRTSGIIKPLHSCLALRTVWSTCNSSARSRFSGAHKASRCGCSGRRAAATY